MTKARAEAPSPPAWRNACRSERHLLAVFWNVLLRVSCSVRFCDVVVPGPWFRDAGRRQQVTAKSQSGPLHGGTGDRRGGRGWHAGEVRRCQGGAEGELLSLPHGGCLLNGRLRRRHGPPGCVCSAGQPRTGRSLCGRRSGRELGRTMSTERMRRRRCKAV